MALTRERRLPGAVLLDKDGTLLENVPYNVDPARMRLAPGAARALRTLGATGMPIAVVSNQPGVALGYFPNRSLARSVSVSPNCSKRTARRWRIFTARITRRAACRATPATASAASRAPGWSGARSRRSAHSPNRAG
jgi:hypothetical protein